MKCRYSLLLSDTVKVGKDTSVVLTDGVTKLKDVVMDLEDVSSTFYRNVYPANTSRRMRNQNPHLNPRNHPNQLQHPSQMASLSLQSSHDHQYQPDAIPKREGRSVIKWNRLQQRRSRRIKVDYTLRDRMTGSRNGRAVMGGREMGRIRLSSGTRVIEGKNSYLEELRTVG